MITKLKVTNARKSHFEFDRLNRMTKGLDLSGLAANVNFSTGAGAGSKYQNTRLNNREFDIEFKMMRSIYDEPQMDGKRGSIYTVFNPELNPLRLDITLSNGKEYYITANLLSSPIMPPDTGNNNGAWQRVLLQFLATDPYIYEKEAKKVDIARWVGAFEFPFESPMGEGFEVGRREQSLFVNVNNVGQNRTGMVVKFKALATVTRPALINIDTQQELRLNFTMTKGDVIEASTYQGERIVTLIRNNVTYDIFNSVDLNSHFLELEQGDNVFRYDALSGVDNLEMSLTYRPKLVGV